MHARREGLESDYARTLHRPIRHTLTTRCGQRCYRRFHRGAACEGYLGITNVDKKEDFYYCGFRHRITVGLLSAITSGKRQKVVADSS